MTNTRNNATELSPKVAHLQSSRLSSQVRMTSSISYVSSSGPSSSVPPPQVEENRPCGFKDGESKPSSSSSGIMTRRDMRAFKALKITKSYHDFDSTVSFKSLETIQKHNSILSESAWHAPLLGQRPYNTYPEGFSISVDALEAGLRFPLHPVIGECLGYAKWRQILSVTS
ncbi:hypothetical protein BHM03_00044933 [Ensete ventricosum]|nr:hypothetical protein BHM03_00044933 [Ensete ventricosum]